MVSTHYDLNGDNHGAWQEDDTANGHPGPVFGLTPDVEVDGQSCSCDQILQVDADIFRPWIRLQRHKQ